MRRFRLFCSFFGLAFGVGLNSSRGCGGFVCPLFKVFFSFACDVGYTRARWFRGFSLVGCIIQRPVL